MWLSSPIIVMIVFGFNNTTGKFNIKWQGFTLNWYRDLFAIPDLTDCAGQLARRSPSITTVIATVLGTFIGIALGKYRFRGSGSVTPAAVRQHRGARDRARRGPAEHVPHARACRAGSGRSSSRT